MSDKIDEILDVLEMQGAALKITQEAIGEIIEVEKVVKARIDQLEKQVNYLEEKLNERTT